MHFSTCPVIGTIAMHSCGNSLDVRLADDADDSSLAALLTSLVHGTSPAVADNHPRGSRFVPANRLSRFGLAGPMASVRADFERLACELDAEYQRVAMA
jgi:hypothetical protein